MQRLMMLAVVLSTATACFGDSDKDPTGSDTEPLSCDEREPDACGGCAEIDARPLTHDTGNACYDTGVPEVVACMDTGMGCDDAIHFVRPADGDESDCMWFSNGCTPVGWVDCGYLETCTN